MYSTSYAQPTTGRSGFIGRDSREDYVSRQGIVTNQLIPKRASLDAVAHVLTRPCFLCREAKIPSLYIATGVEIDPPLPTSIL